MENGVTISKSKVLEAKAFSRDEAITTVLYQISKRLTRYEYSKSKAQLYWTYVMAQKNSKKLLDEVVSEYRGNEDLDFLDNETQYEMEKEYLSICEEILTNLCVNASDEEIKDLAKDLKSRINEYRI